MKLIFSLVLLMDTLTDHNSKHSNFWLPLMGHTLTYSTHTQLSTTFSHWQSIAVGLVNEEARPKWLSAGTTNADGLWSTRPPAIIFPCIVNLANRVSIDTMTMDVEKRESKASFLTNSLCPSSVLVIHLNCNHHTDCPSTWLSFATSHSVAHNHQKHLHPATWVYTLTYVRAYGPWEERKGNCLTKKWPPHNHTFSLRLFTCSLWPLASSLQQQVPLSLSMAYTSSALFLNNLSSIADGQLAILNASSPTHLLKNST